MAILVNEESNINDTIGVTPTEKDVLLGKGTPINNHQGNKKFRHLIKLNHERYDNAPEGKKNRVAWDVVDFLYNQGCRFLQKTGGVRDEVMKKRTGWVWEEVPKKRAYAKAQQTLRDGAPIRRERKHRLLKERLQEQASTTTETPRTAVTPPPQMATSIPTVVSPVASLAVFFPSEDFAPLSVQQDQQICPSVVSLEDSCSDTTGVSDDELEALLLQPADHDDNGFFFFEEDEAILLQPADPVDDGFVFSEKDEVFCSRTYVEQTLLSDDSSSDDDNTFGLFPI